MPFVNVLIKKLKVSNIGIYYNVIVPRLQSSSSSIADTYDTIIPDPKKNTTTFIAGGADLLPCYDIIRPITEDSNGGSNLSASLRILDNQERSDGGGDIVSKEKPDEYSLVKKVTQNYANYNVLVHCAESPSTLQPHNAMRASTTLPQEYECFGNVIPSSLQGAGATDQGRLCRRVSGGSSSASSSSPPPPLPPPMLQNNFPDTGGMVGKEKEVTEGVAKKEEESLYCNTMEVMAEMPVLESCDVTEVLLMEKEGRKTPRVDIYMNVDVL